MFNSDQSLAELALALPAASRIFRTHRLDFCCDGSRSLQQACAERGLDVASVLHQLNAAPRTAGLNTSDLALAELIDYVLAQFHEAHRAELPDLIALATKVERVHAGTPDAPLGLAAHLQEMARALEEHMQKEEAVLFPAILRGAGPGLTRPIAVMEAEHDEHGRSLERLRELAHDFVAPAHACTSWRALYLRAEQLEADLMAHVHLENHVLFPRGLRGLV